ncbi:MAG: ABC transporter ATP-binding protein [Pseudomonadota bacterium]
MRRFRHQKAAGRISTESVRSTCNSEAGVMLSLKGVGKRFGRTIALEDFSLSVDVGEVVALVGANGAGKTTALRIAAGFLAPDRGEVIVDGCLVGYLPESNPLYGDMRVDEYLRFRARLKGVSAKVATTRVDEMMELFRLGHVRHHLIAQLSRGYRQRVGIADAVVARPPVLLLDEPGAALDPTETRELRGLLCELGRHHAVLLSSHMLAEVEAVAHRVAIVARGRLVAIHPIRAPGANAPFVRHELPDEDATRSAVTEAWVRLADVETASAALGNRGWVADATAGKLLTSLSSDETARVIVHAGCGLLLLRPVARSVGRSLGRSIEDLYAEATR